MQQYVNMHQVVGNLGADAEFVDLHVTEGEPRFSCSFRVACTKRWKGRSGKAKERTTWFNVKMYLGRKGVDHFRPILKSGRLVLVKGEHLEDQWEGDKGPRHFQYIEADTVLPIAGPDRKPADPHASTTYAESDDEAIGKSPAPPDPPPSQAKGPAPPAVPPAPSQPQKRQHPLPSDAALRFDIVNW